MFRQDRFAGSVDRYIKNYSSHFGEFFLCHPTLITVLGRDKRFSKPYCHSIRIASVGILAVTEPVHSRPKVRYFIKRTVNFDDILAVKVNDAPAELFQRHKACRWVFFYPVPAIIPKNDRIILVLRDNRVSPGFSEKQVFTINFDISYLGDKFIGLASEAASCFDRMDIFGQEPDLTAGKLVYYELYTAYVDHRYPGINGTIEVTFLLEFFGYKVFYLLGNNGGVRNAALQEYSIYSRLIEFGVYDEHIPFTFFFDNHLAGHSEPGIRIVKTADI